jgi:hypothetical protein
VGRRLTHSVIVGVDIQPPEELLLPPRQRGWADGLDVGDGHEAQHLQPVLDAHGRGEVSDNLRILRVAAEGHLRHAQVLANQEQNGFALGLGQPQLIEKAFGEPDAFDRVIFFLPLADVVQQQREDQQLRRREIAQQRREPLPFGRRVRQPLEVADRQQRVLVNGVLVVEVAHDAARDRLKRRNHPAEQRAVVHLRQARVKAGAGREKRQQRSAVLGGREEILELKPLRVVTHQGERLIRY